MKKKYTVSAKDGKIVAGEVMENGEFIKDGYTDVTEQAMTAIVKLCRKEKPEFFFKDDDGKCFVMSFTEITENYYLCRKIANEQSKEEELFNVISEACTILHNDLFG